MTIGARVFVCNRQGSGVTTPATRGPAGREPIGMPLQVPGVRIPPLPANHQTGNVLVPLLSMLLGLWAARSFGPCKATVFFVVFRRCEVGSIKSSLLQRFEGCLSILHRTLETRDCDG